MNFEEARKMYEDYNCNEYNMKIDGVLYDYQSYNVPIELQQQWKNEFIKNEYKKLKNQKDLYSLNLLSSFAKDSTKPDILLQIYEVYKDAKNNNDWVFLSKLCCSLINSINLFHVKNDSTFIMNLIDELINEINIINMNMENDLYIKKIFEENGIVEQTKKILERSKQEALRIKEKSK